jgi:hypothetical protein
MDSNTGDNQKGILDSDLDFYYAKGELILTSSYSMYEYITLASSNSFGFYWIMFKGTNLHFFNV